jgi:hypothetical protein
MRCSSDSNEFIIAKLSLFIDPMITDLEFPAVSLSLFNQVISAASPSKRNFASVESFGVFNSTFANPSALIGTLNFSTDPMGIHDCSASMIAFLNSSTRQVNDPVVFSAVSLAGENEDPPLKKMRLTPNSQPFDILECTPFIDPADIFLVHDYSVSITFFGQVLASMSPLTRKDASIGTSQFFDSAFAIQSVLVEKIIPSRISPDIHFGVVDFCSPMNEFFDSLSRHIVIAAGEDQGPSLKKMRISSDSQPFDIFYEICLPIESPDLELSSSQYPTELSSNFVSFSNLPSPDTLSQLSYSSLSTASLSLSSIRDAELPLIPFSQPTSSLHSMLLHGRMLVEKQKYLNLQKSRKISSLKVQIDKKQNDIVLLKNVRDLSDQIETLSGILWLRVKIYRTNCLALTFNLTPQVCYQLSFSLEFLKNSTPQLTTQSISLSDGIENSSRLTENDSELDKLAKIYYFEVMSSENGPLSFTSLSRLTFPSDIKLHLPKVLPPSFPFSQLVLHCPIDLRPHRHISSYDFLADPYRYHFRGMVVESSYDQDN